MSIGLLYVRRLYLLKENREEFLLRRNLQFSVNISAVDSYRTDGYSETPGNGIRGMTFQDLSDHLGFSWCNPGTKQGTHRFLDDFVVITCFQPSGIGFKLAMHTLPVALCKASDKLSDTFQQLEFACGEAGTVTRTHQRDNDCYLIREIKGVTNLFGESCLHIVGTIVFALIKAIGCYILQSV